MAPPGYFRRRFAFCAPPFFPYDRNAARPWGRMGAGCGVKKAIVSNSSRTGRSARDIDLAALIATGFQSRARQFALFLLVSLATRIAAFGDTNYFGDELLYFLIGQRMHDGLLPYVGVWDRKGPGLFLIYYGIAGISQSVIAYQLAACLFAALTAFAVNLIAGRFAGRPGALLAGAFYLVMLPLFGGGGGQAPVFYNLFMALAALAVIRQVPRLDTGKADASLYLAMASAGFAITFKQTAAFEGVFFGGFVLWRLFRGGMRLPTLLVRGAGLALAGAAPILLFAAFYAATGHFTEFWHALVTSNLQKPSDPGSDAGRRLGALATIASPLLLPSLASLLLLRAGGRRPIPRGLLGGWLLAALAGFACIPNFIDHYTLPLLLPLAVAAAPALEWRRIGPIYAGFSLLLALLAGPAPQFARHRNSQQAMERIAADIRARDPHPRLFIYQGPIYLYALLDSYPPTPLLYPPHLFHLPERNTSHLDTAGEVRKVLAWQPTVVLRAPGFAGRFLNRETADMVDAYLARCRLWSKREVPDYYAPYTLEIYGDCARSGAAPKRSG